MDFPQKKGEKIHVEIDADLKELIPGYLSNIADTINKIKSAVTEDNMELCRFSGHNLKGSGASYGLDFISQAGQQIELLAQKKDGAGICSCLDHLENWLADIEISYAPYSE